MAVGKHTIPQSTVDKNGKQTTVHVNPAKAPKAGSSKRTVPPVTKPDVAAPSLLPTSNEVNHSGSVVRFYTAEQKSVNFPRAFHAALLHRPALRYSSAVASIEFEVYGQPVFVGEEDDAKTVSARLKKDGVDNVIVYDPHGGYQIAQRFSVDVGLQPTESDIAHAYQWVEDEMDTWGARVNEEVSHYRMGKKKAS